MNKVPGFDSIKKLDELFALMNGKNLERPSEVMKLYTNVENLLIDVYQRAFTRGYDKGVEISEQSFNMLKIKTQNERSEAIKLLQNQKLNIPEYSMFNDPNHKVINAQIQVIDECMNAKSIKTLWGNEFDKEAEETNYITKKAFKALSWLNGEIETSELIEE